MTELDRKLEEILCNCLASLSTAPSEHDVDCPYGLTDKIKQAFANHYDNTHEGVQP